MQGGDKVPKILLREELPFLKIKEATKATIRLIPINPQVEAGRCIYSGKPSSYRVVFAKAY
jgi:prolyl-tRNA synthetase